MALAEAQESTKGPEGPEAGKTSTPKQAIEGLSVD